MIHVSSSTKGAGAHASLSHCKPATLGQWFSLIHQRVIEVMARDRDSASAIGGSSAEIGTRLHQAGLKDSTPPRVSRAHPEHQDDAPSQARLAKKEKAIRAWIEANPKEIERIARYREEADLYADAAAERRLCALMRSKSD